ncbi:unnamed protein product [Macrosiphum euphorbiae]|uniref:Uncharacterized protein n=1 Tax=Macrosiphum euphorbiae TaxID=13131 RepID=A0AAV0WG60_9HEMI|nr:unnamed protein product [Macrosiphum euphorbiae]
MTRIGDQAAKKGGVQLVAVEFTMTRNETAPKAGVRLVDIELTAHRTAGPKNGHQPSLRDPKGGGSRLL